MEAPGLIPGRLRKWLRALIRVRKNGSQPPECFTIFNQMGFTLTGLRLDSEQWAFWIEIFEKVYFAKYDTGVL